MEPIKTKNEYAVWNALKIFPRVISEFFLQHNQLPQKGWNFWKNTSACRDWLMKR